MPNPTMTTTDSIEARCRDCRRVIQLEGDQTVLSSIAPRLLSQMRCDECADVAERKARVKQADDAQAALRQAWQGVCPPKMLETRESELRAINGRAFDQVMGQRDPGHGLLLIGPTRRGKTRTAWEFLRRQFMAGKSVEASKAVTFSLTAGWIDGRFEYERWLAQRLKVDWLFLDDIGKAKFTDQGEAILFDVVDQRMENGKPCLFTTNDTAGTLKERLSEGRADALLARVRECCRVVKFD